MPLLGQLAALGWEFIGHKEEKQTPVADQPVEISHPGVTESATQGAMPMCKV